MPYENIIETVLKNNSDVQRFYAFYLVGSNEFNRDYKRLKDLLNPEFLEEDKEDLKAIIVDRFSNNRQKYILLYTDYFFQFFATSDNDVYGDFLIYYSDIDNIKNVDSQIVFKTKENKTFNFAYTKNSQTLNKVIFSVFEDILKKIEEISKEHTLYHDELNKKIEKAKEEKNWELLLSLSEEYIQFVSYFSLKVFGLLQKTQALLQLNRIEEAKTTYTIAENLFEENKEQEEDKELLELSYVELTEAKQLFYEKEKKYEELYFYLNKNSNYTSVENIKTTYKEMIDNFDKINDRNRKVIYVDSKLPTSRTENILPIDINYTGNLKFPIGHPKKGELYVAHPLRPNVYYHTSNYEEMLWDSQTMELNTFLQNLGAVKIINERTLGASDKSNSSFSSSDKNNSSQQVAGGGEYLKFGASFEHNKGSSQNNQTDKNRTEENSQQKKTVTSQEFKPNRKPFISDDLIWYPHNELWQNLAKQRLSGGLLNAEITLSSESVSIISESEKEKIEQDLNSLVKGQAKLGLAKINGSVKKSQHSEASVSSKFSMTKRVQEEWKIKVEFAPIDEIVETALPSQSDENKLSEKEQKYLDAVNFSLKDDGMISDTERRRLERVKKRYEISEEKAKELEELALKNQYTENELDYLEELKAIFEEEGQIDEADRELLIRLKKELNISDERAKTLENMIFG